MRVYHETVWACGAYSDFQDMQDLKWHGSLITVNK
jgi:hypothetical protein